MPGVPRCATPSPRPSPVPPGALRCDGRRQPHVLCSVYFRRLEDEQEEEELETERKPCNPISGGWRGGGVTVWA